MENSRTNGPLIKIKGDNNIVKFKQLDVINTTSYGQVIENTSLKVCSNLF